MLKRNYRHTVNALTITMTICTAYNRELRLTGFAAKDNENLHEIFKQIAAEIRLASIFPRTQQCRRLDASNSPTKQRAK